MAVFFKMIHLQKVSSHGESEIALCLEISTENQFIYGPKFLHVSSNPRFLHLSVVLAGQFDISADYTALELNTHLVYMTGVMVVWFTYK